MGSEQGCCTGFRNAVLAVTLGRAFERLWGTVAVIDYRLLGPIEAGVDGRPLDIGGRRQRALLAVLLLSANEPVSRDCLAERLWGATSCGCAAHPGGVRFAAPEGAAAGRWL
jgi:hypothetical protein